MKGSDIKVGMIVAVRDERRDSFDMQARKAQVVETGLTSKSHSFSAPRTDSTSVHFFQAVSGADYNTPPGETYTDELREYDPEAQAPYPDRELDKQSEEYKSLMAAYHLASDKRSAQRTVRNQQVYMPWDEYVAEVNKRRAALRSKREQEQTVRKNKAAQRLAIEQRLAALGLTVMPEDAERSGWGQYDFYWNNERLTAGESYAQAERLVEKLEKLALDTPWDES